MITPRFNLSQDALTLTIKIRAPYCNLKELDISVENSEFIFVCIPYYLRLNLPGNILENNSSSSFDADTGEFIFTYKKQNSGETFNNLDFITTFLQPKIEIESGGRKIEVLTSEKDIADCPNEDTSVKYGFALRGGYNFQHIILEFTEIFKIDPYTVTFSERRDIRISHENEKFDPDHYIADIMDDTEIFEICNIKCPWQDIDYTCISFTDKELDFLKDLPNIEYNLTSQQINYCYNSLIDILFAYCYDRRATFFEGTCESGWNILTICASLSYFDSFSSPKDTLVSAYRRSLTYPLYRSFKLCDKVFEDLRFLLKSGEKYIIQCLINIHDIFLKGNSGHYILNKLYINDYIIYMMKCHSSSWVDVVEEVCTIKINKNDLGLNLLQIEDSINNDELSAVLGNLKVTDDTDSDDTDACSESESTSSTESDSDDSASDISESDNITNNTKVDQC